MKFSIKYLFSKCDQIYSFLRIWSHLLKTLFFFAVHVAGTFHAIVRKYRPLEVAKGMWHTDIERR